MQNAKCLHLHLCFVIAGLISLLSLNTIDISTQQVLASQENVKWVKVNIPTEGAAGNWVLAEGSDIQHLTVASDGTLYAYVKAYPTPCINP